MMPAMKITLSVEFTLSPDQAKEYSEDKAVTPRLLRERVNEELQAISTDTARLPGDIATTVAKVEYDYGVGWTAQG